MATTEQMAEEALHRGFKRLVQGETISFPAPSPGRPDHQMNMIRRAQHHLVTLKEMQRLSRRVLFSIVPHPPRRKKLGKKVLGLI